jgi:hypothetical protein
MAFDIFKVPKLEQHYAEIGNVLFENSFAQSTISLHGNYFLKIAR